MKTADIKNDIFYFLDMNAYNVNDPEARIVEMAIVVEKNKSYGYAKQGYYTLKFEISDEIFNKDDQSEHPIFFASREEAEAQFQRQAALDVAAVRDLPKEELLIKFFRLWSHESIRNETVYTAMVEKIKAEFGVDVLADN